MAAKRFDWRGSCGLLDEGIPYRALIASVLHARVSGRLADRPGSSSRPRSEPARALVRAFGLPVFLVPGADRFFEPLDLDLVEVLPARCRRRRRSEWLWPPNPQITPASPTALGGGPAGCAACSSPPLAAADVPGLVCTPSRRCRPRRGHVIHTHGRTTVALMLQPTAQHGTAQHGSAPLCAVCISERRCRRARRTRRVRGDRISTTSEE